MNKRIKKKLMKKNFLDSLETAKKLFGYKNNKELKEEGYLTSIQDIDNYFLN